MSISIDYTQQFLYPRTRSGVRLVQIYTPGIDLCFTNQNKYDSGYLMNFQILKE